MDREAVFLHFGGEWNDAMKYIGYSKRGIFLDGNCSYENLQKIVSRQLFNDDVHHSFKLQYQVFESDPVIPICDDASLQFYLEFKRGETDKRSYPIVVHVDVQAPRSNQQCNGNRLDAGHEVNHNSEICSMTTGDAGSVTPVFIEQIPTVEEMAMELCDYVILQNDDYEDGELLRCVITKPNIADVKIGAIFRNKDLLITSMSLLAIHNRFQFVVMKSDSKFYWLRCLKDGCKWTLKSSRTGNIGHFKVREFNSTHICSNDLVLCDHRQATSFVIANCIKHNFLSSKRIYTATDIMEDMHHTYGVIVSYDKAWRARERAIKMIRGDPDDSYGILPAYMHRLEVANPGSYTRIETDSDDRFLFSFVALGASISGWIHCKPVIVVDGTFLTCRYRGTLFTACAQDANNNIFILAFGVGDAENNNAWEWFMLRLKEAYGDRDGLCIVSDRHGSIAHAVDKVFPNALQAACTYHLLQNIKRHYGKKAKGVRSPFNDAVRAYTIADFETHMGRIDDIEVDISGFLENVGFERWSRAHMTKDRYSTMTSNIAESVNSAIKHVKNYPIETLHEFLRCIMQKWFFKNLSDAKSTFTALATRHDHMLNKRINKSFRLRVYPSSDTIFQVNDETSGYVVNMDDRTCSCRRFQVDHIPCPHAVEVIAKRNYALSDYCSRYFTKEEYIATYQASIYPLGNKEDWHIPDEVKNKRVLAPISKRGPGRPKENRFKSTLEYKKRTRCGNCDGSDHNIRTCPNGMSKNDRNVIKRNRSSAHKKKR